MSSMSEMERTIGPEINQEAKAKFPLRKPQDGHHTSLVPLQPSHAKPLYDHLGGEEKAHLWTHLFQGPYLTYEAFEEDVSEWSESQDPLYFTVMSRPLSDPAAEPLGFVTFMSIVLSHRRIEIGSVCFSEKLQRTRQATETFYLLMNEAFTELLHHRVEWKADHLNKPSLAAAERLGFVFEGVFRKHMVVKGRRRDTACYSITNDEWPTIKGGLELWLSKDNFDRAGTQRRTLKQCRDEFQARPARTARLGRGTRVKM